MEEKIIFLINGGGIINLYGILHMEFNTAALANLVDRDDNRSNRLVYTPDAY